MESGQHADELAAHAAEAVRRILADAEERAAGIVRDAEAQAASIREQAEAEAQQTRERGEADARAQIEAAKRALDELGGTLVAAATEAIPKQESTPAEPDAEPEPEPAPAPAPEPDPEPEPVAAPEAPVSPPVEPEQAAPAEGNGDDAAVRLVAMKLAVDGKDPAAIEAELIEKFGPGDRTDLLRDVIARSSS
jgi:outer membrane biosynthesis protein TonB